MGVRTVSGYATAVPIWIAWYLFLHASVAEPLEDPRVVAWRPADGHVLVLCEGGQRIRTFDPLLRPVEDRMLVAPAVAAAGWRGGWLLEDPSGQVTDLSGAALSPPTGLAFARGLECPGPGSRRYRLDPERGSLTAGPAIWEHAGEVEWGPSWAALRIRSSRVLGDSIEWRVAGEPSRRARLRTDPDDPLLQIAWLEPVAAGVRLELRFRPPFRAYPQDAWSPWVELQAPEVRPAGPRPVTVLQD